MCPIHAPSVFGIGSRVSLSAQPIGSLWDTPLPQLLAEYRAEAHPVCGPLVEGGPARLARAYGIAPETGPADACHLCFQARRALIDRFPEVLTPRQVYGLD